MGPRCSWIMYLSVTAATAAMAVRISTSVTEVSSSFCATRTCSHVCIFCHRGGGGLVRIRNFRRLGVGWGLVLNPGDAPGFLSHMKIAVGGNFTNEMPTDAPREDGVGEQVESG